MVSLVWMSRILEILDSCIEERGMVQESENGWVFVLLEGGVDVFIGSECIKW